MARHRHPAGFPGHPAARCLHCPHFCRVRRIDTDAIPT